MAEDSFEEKSEAPTPKKRRESREKGTVAKSTEINSVLVLFAGIFLLKFLGGYILDGFNAIFLRAFSMLSRTEMDTTDFITIIRLFVAMSFSILLPVILTIMFVGIIANVMQIGFLFTLKPIVPKFEKINPISGLKRMFAMRSLVEAAKSILKFSIIGLVAYITIKGRFDELIVLGFTDVGPIFLFMLNVGFTIVVRVALVLIILAILDYSFQRYEHEKKLKMTHQEIKEERKQMDGDPQVKARIKSLQREMARRRMMGEVPKATVVVTNPTTLAIAIRYVSDEMDAPQIIAKGKQYVAEKIKEIARKDGIPIVEDKPLARAMYDQVELGDSVPIEFYTAVAEILAYVFKLKNRAA